MAGAAVAAMILGLGVVRSALPALERDPVSDLRLGLRSALDDRAFRQADWSVLAVSLDSGDTLLALDPERALAPASNLKLFTTAAALHHLGPDFRWTTLLLSEAPIVEGRLRGDLVLYGTGDPGLAERQHRSDDAPFDSLAAQLSRRGVRRIEGRLLGDGTFFVGPERLAEWDPRDLNDWFTAASPALAYAENVVQFRIEASGAGRPPQVHLDPGHGGVAVSNEARTSPGRPTRPLWLLRDDPTLPVRVTGEMARQERDIYRSMTVQDPVLWTAYAMAAALERQGIEIVGGVGRIVSDAESTLSPALVHATGPGRVSTARPESPRPRAALLPLATFTSPPLIDALEIVNQRSHNLYADMVLKTLGRVVEGEGSFAGGARAVERFAVDEVGIDPTEIRVLDGSGLAAENRTSARALVQVLAWAADGDRADLFERTLPAAGSRELNRRMGRTAASGNLRAKTGTIAGVSALSGIVRTRDGERVAFSIVGNGLRSPYYAKRRVEDELGVALAELGGRITLQNSDLTADGLDGDPLDGDRLDGDH
jgi:D-alanyl-D-alanine carboxypeptidase/D-alanyl-D-alanine-endopeptidase (penicillin-binding protein 4)